MGCRVAAAISFKARK